MKVGSRSASGRRYYDERSADRAIDAKVYNLATYKKEHSIRPSVDGVVAHGGESYGGAHSQIYDQWLHKVGIPGLIIIAEEGVG